MSLELEVNPTAFPSPWAARAFAIVRAMEEKGIFSDKDFQQALILSIKGKEDAGNEIHGEIAYYDCWVEAMMNLINSKGFCMESIADHEKAVRLRIADSHHEHNHGSKFSHDSSTPCFVEKP